MGSGEKGKGGESETRLVEINFIYNTPNRFNLLDFNMIFDFLENGLTWQ